MLTELSVWKIVIKLLLNQTTSLIKIMIEMTYSLMSGLANLRIDG